MFLEDLDQTKGKSQALSSSFPAFLIASRSSYIITQSSFTSFSPKNFKLKDLDINSKGKNNITVI